MRGVQGYDIEKDPDDVLDYVLDFSVWLAGDTLSTVTATGTGVTVASATVNVSTLTITENGVSRTVAAGNAVVLWLSAGVESVPARVQVRIVTAGARTRDVLVRVLPRSSIRRG